WSAPLCGVRILLSLTSALRATRLRLAALSGNKANKVVRASGIVTSGFTVLHGELQRDCPAGSGISSLRFDNVGERDEAVFRDIAGGGSRADRAGPRARSEEHTSELQSRRDLVCRL